MNAAPASLERRAISLGSANALDYALQFLLPIVLTRTLDPHSFGEYRLLWLAVNALMLILPMCMAHSLYYFLPRSEPRAQRLYINQALLFLAGAGIVSAWALSVWNPLLPAKLAAIAAANDATVPAFALLWLIASALDVLPTADERVGWQTKAIVALSAVRTLSLGAAAIVTHDLGAVLWMLLAFTALKVALLFVYVARYHGLGGPVARRESFCAQLKQVAPFALSGALNGIRNQGDQWIAAAVFSVALFASFSIATVLAPLVQLFRQSVNNVFLPSMSRLESAGEVVAMLRLNNRANIMVALLVYPMLAFAFVFAEQVITLVYTSAYLDAAPVLRLYVLGLLASVVELVSVLFVLRQGNFAASVNAIVLCIALPLSWFGATHWGLVGAAIGSVTALYAERVVSLHRISRLAHIPIRRLQDWGALLGILAAATLSAVVAGVALRSSTWSPLATLAVGGLLFAAVYPAALLVTGQARQVADFYASLRAVRA